MPTSEKYAEKCLPLELPEFKRRLVHCGDHELDCYRRDVTAQRKARLQTQGVYVKPLQGAECAEGGAILCVEAVDALKGRYALDIAIADQAQAYTSTKRNEEDPLRCILIRKRDFELVPETRRAHVARLLEQDPRGVRIPLNVFLYGKLAAGHKYERPRNVNYTSVGCKQKQRTSAFRSSF